MPAQTNVAYATRGDWDAGTITTIFGGIVALLTAIFGGGNLWNYFKDRKKIDVDAQTVMFNGFMSMNTQSQARIERLEQRNQELETENQRCNRRTARFERLLIEHGIAFPLEEP